MGFWDEFMQEILVAASRDTNTYTVAVEPNRRNSACTITIQCREEGASTHYITNVISWELLNSNIGAHAAHSMIAQLDAVEDQSPRARYSSPTLIEEPINYQWEAARTQYPEEYDGIYKDERNEEQ